MPSIKDVAKIAECSTSTVSRVINNRDAVSPQTKKRVLDAIDKLDYKPNLVAQGLRVKRGNLIGLVVPESTSHAFNVIIQYAMDAARKREYNIIIVNSHEDPDLEESFISDLLRRNINGIIFSRVSDESRIVSKIVKTDIPIVVVDRAFENEKVSNVVLDNRKAGYLAGSHLCNLGHREIACVTGPLKIALCRERLRGFRDALNEQGVTLHDNCIIEGNFIFESGIRAIQKLLHTNCNFTAVWTQNDMMGFGALKELYRMNMCVPEQVSVIGMDDLEFGNMVIPPLTSIHYPFDELVDRAMDLLINQINEGYNKTETVIIEPKLTIKESTKRLQKRLVETGMQ
jgi:LacI family transcriptional regulator